MFTLVLVENFEIKWMAGNIFIRFQKEICSILKEEKYICVFDLVLGKKIHIQFLAIFSNHF